jgi:hypothetical protein
LQPEFSTRETFGIVAKSMPPKRYSNYSTIWCDMMHQCILRKKCTQAGCEMLLWRIIGCAAKGEAVCSADMSCPMVVILWRGLTSTKVDCRKLFALKELLSQETMLRVRMALSQMALPSGGLGGNYCSILAKIYMLGAVSKLSLWFFALVTLLGVL